MNTHSSCLILALSSLLPWSVSQAQDEEAVTFDLSARLSGAQEVTPPDAPTTPSPGVMTDTTGDVLVRVAEDLSSLAFVLNVNNGSGVTQAHLHCGRPGENGPVVVFLSPMDAEARDVNGQLAEGTRTNEHIEATAEACEELIGRPVRNIASLAAAAFDGLIYANVHTVANPAGEVRGQLIPDGDDDTQDPEPPMTRLR
jgi:CHRD domain.|nr:CHRD domain-containing protein [uncultured Steroidobacter sp.]